MNRFFIFAAVFLLACTSGPLAPVEPAWGKQPCDHCAMLLSEPTSAAQAVMADGSRKFFDDIGCLAAYLAQPGARALASWVRTPDARWADAQHAHYTHGHSTPMDYGYLAAREGISFAELQHAVLAKNHMREASP